MSAFVQVLALSLLASSASEAISYALVYRTEQFQALKQKVVQNEIRLEEEKQNTAGNGKHRQRRIESIEAQLSAARSKASSLQLRNMLVVALIQLVSVYQISAMYGGVVVGTLPFEPLSVFRSLTHRGLPEDSPSNACSATFVFVLGGLMFKALLDRYLQLGMPKGSSLPKWVTNPEDIIGGTKK
ncbi:Calcium load-activated calcium channel [Coemansia aciculifera]|uniref:Calcium load-activated calcium channel n=1 Tax=Coemansia aciculifera TaxID=417176 RepID=A0ACC1M7K4_9FUNG|nr:Calcium load-activated calcium channel [Coemansia aciculifera]KAJ2910124.1 Calcium load-activated calcium channel [Coemansia aciculifera]